MKTASARTGSAPATPIKPVSRAVLRRIEPGNLATCAHCDQLVKFAAKMHLLQVICNVYVGGRWQRVEHYHEDCYNEADKPHGDASTDGLSRLPKGSAQPLLR